MKSSTAWVTRRGGGVPALDAERQHRAGSAHLAPDETERVALGQAGPPHLAHVRLGGQPGDDLAGGLLLRAHPQRERRQPAVEQVGPHRVEEGPGHRADAAQRLGPLLGARDHAAHGVTVTAEVLRRAVQHQRGSVVGGVLQHGRGEGVVDEHRHVTGGRGDRADVDELERRVGRGLEDHEAGVGAHGTGHLLGRAVGRLDAQHPGGQQVVGPAVQRTYGDDVATAPRSQRRKDGRGHRRHPGGVRHRCVGALQVGERLLEAGDRGVPEPLVDHAAVARVAAGRHRLVRLPAGVDARQRVGRGQVEREGVHAEAGQVGATRVHGEGVEAHHGRHRRGICRLEQ